MVAETLPKTLEAANLDHEDRTEDHRENPPKSLELTTNNLQRNLNSGF